jgi:small conductance mechanosensitive channel
MRGFLLPAFILIFAVFVTPRPGSAQSNISIHQPAPQTTTATPAKATAGAIIPGSPLAALTGAAAPGQPAPASPFGTGSFGLSILSAIGNDAAHSTADLLLAIRRSTELTPVVGWVDSFRYIPTRRQHAADVVSGLAMSLLPALIVDAAIGFALRRPRAAIVARAGRHTPPSDISADPEDGAGDDSPDDTVPEGEEGLAYAEAGGSETGGTKIRPRRRDELRAWGRRLGFGLLGLLLAILPIFGFGLTAAAIITAGFVPVREAQLTVIGTANAYLVCRLVLAFAGFLFAPRAEPVRLIHMPDERAAAITRWIAILLISGAVGFVIVSAAEILSLSPPGVRAITALFALAVHIELAVAVWQSRFVVAGWIRGGNKKKRAYGFRNGLARAWHFVALFYILSLWIALAGGVHNAFGLLLRVVLVFIAAAGFGGWAWRGSTQALERLFPDPHTGSARHPKFAARARAYNPLVRVLIRLVITFLVLIAILLGWGINIVPWLLTDPISRALIMAFISIIVTVAIALFLWEICNAWIIARIERLAATGRTRQASRLRTLLPMLKATIGTVIGLVAGLICLSKIGVNAAPLLAGAGVVGIAVGFGSQKLVQDIITGLFLLLEDAMQVGDVITLASMTGTVERLSIRTIRLRGGDGSINIIPFSAVTTVTNMTRDFGYAEISIQVAYEEDLAHVYAVMTDIARTMRAEPAWGAMMRDDLQIFGLDQFGASALVITGQIRTGPGQHWAVRREYYARVKRRFEEENIEMPYTYLPPAPRPAPESGQLSLPSGQPEKASDKPETDH